MCTKIKAKTFSVQRYKVDLNRGKELRLDPDFTRYFTPNVQEGKTEMPVIINQAHKSDCASEMDETFLVLDNNNRQGLSKKVFCAQNKIESI